MKPVHYKKTVEIPSGTGSGVWSYRSTKREILIRSPKMARFRVSRSSLPTATVGRVREYILTRILGRSTNAFRLRTFEQFVNLSDQDIRDAKYVAIGTIVLKDKDGRLLRIPRLKLIADGIFALRREKLAERNPSHPILGSLMESNSALEDKWK